MALAAPFPTLGQASHSPRRSNDSTLRLTRRGRIVVSLGAVALVGTGVFLGGQAAAQAGTSPSSSPSMVSVVVKPGESLWQIVQRVNPGADPREMVLRVREINGMSDSAVVAGSTLVIPAA